MVTILRSKSGDKLEALGLGSRRAYLAVIIFFVGWLIFNASDIPAADLFQPSSEDARSADAGGDELDEEWDQPVLTVADPLEPLNRAFFVFNDRFYFWFLKPVARAYNFVLPRPAREGVKNFFANVTTPIRLVSCVFQGKFNAAAIEWNRFFFNSTIGILGFFDAAKKYGNVQASDEDFGQTLGCFGIGHGIYITWPFLGPSTLRDTFGLAADSFLDPVSYLHPWYASIGVKAYDKGNDTSLRLGDYESVIEAAVDPYAAIRDGYIQHRQKEMEK